MKDINKPVRLAFFEALNGNLSYEGDDVPVSDNLKNVNAKYYVLLKNQSSTPDGTKQTFSRNASITLDIVTKTGDRITSDIADDIAHQILTIIIPTPNTHSLPTPATWQFLNVEVTDDRYLDLTITGTNTGLRRLLTFSLRVVQN